ncbi:hypothetical protein DQE82_26920 [Micromonospora sp. LHW51205]|uniref:hypothetical protein n=1 Tax=Micromonospora sp. LHW51205 TaxID=2248752 RepID=UPI000DE846D8|nr:hypothetical protein [Micromonospora sp. LHW51205]RBQ05179.1 hypothetical protein DQE82_26920 [Micromonospora sp. LHW51205]
MTTTTPRRITTLQYLKAAVATRLGLEPEHEGATPEWAELLRNGLAERPAAGRRRLAAPARPALPAIAAVPHREVVDEHLGVLRVAGLEPARIHDALAGGAR